MERRVGEGMTKVEVIRCLKRYVAREVFRTYVPSFSGTSPRRLDVYRSI